MDTEDKEEAPGEKLNKQLGHLEEGHNGLELEPLDALIIEASKKDGDVDLVDDLFTSLVSSPNGLELGCKIIEHFYSTGMSHVARYLYPKLVAAGDNVVIEMIFKDTAKHMSKVDHVAHLNYPGGSTWAKMLKRAARMQKDFVGDMAREIIRDTQQEYPTSD